jgi:hypothetical protein
MIELLCPNCHQLLDLGQAASFDFIVVGRHECPGCGAPVIIENNVPRLADEDQLRQ